MSRESMLDLEKRLSADLIDSDPALLNRCRELVHDFLLQEAGRIGMKQPARDVAAVESLILLHWRVEILRRLVDNPKSFTIQELKKLFPDNPNVPGKGEKVDPLSFIAGLDIKDPEKARLTGDMLDAAKQNIRRELSGDA